ncbi:MAG: hypothetical protein A2Z18_04095 [Armatimonadetes bacterium RBG_16_58_9]|nr:MAG: hypothetical protein A2Z18_04095 [Armatimonadetes bacterium RBG_16_58_9]
MLLLIAQAAWAAQDIEIEMKGTYVYWFTYRDADGNDRVSAPERFKGKSAKLDAGSLDERCSDVKLHVMDKSTGNMAIASYSPPKEKEPKPIKLNPDDFEYVRNVRLKIVTEDGAPLESALVEITDGAGTPMRALVTPADEGIASFGDVATGEMNVKVIAKGATKTIDSAIEIPLERKTPGFESDVKVAGDVHTLAVSEDGKKTPEGKPGKEESKAASSLILQSIAGLVLIIVVIAVIYAILKSRGMSAQDALRKMGAQIPPEGQPQPGPVADSNVCPFCGQTKDAAGNCACTVTPGTAPAGAPTAGPRLVGSQGTYSGQIFEISAGQVVIGRETGDIALSNDGTVSRRHATITAADGSYTIRDEGSSNGTFVNGAKIAEQTLAAGDEVQIGATKFRFQL